MPLPKAFTTVTPLSKALAMILFIAFPFIGFYIGMQYQKMLTSSHSLSSISPTQEVPYQTKELCESQTGKVCEFSMCDYAPGGVSLEEACGGKIKKGWYPISETISSQPTIPQESFCGGIAGKKCPTGYTCQITDRYPDAGGKCVTAPPLPNCTHHVPIGQTGSIPPSYIYPTLPPGGSYCPDTKPDPPNDGVACTQEAKTCSDGSYVSRTGPNCEFATCPGN